jgi:hypothetical protein
MNKPDVLDSFSFLGYDIRIGIRSQQIQGTEKEFLISIDRSIFERTPSLIQSGIDDTTKYGLFEDWNNVRECCLSLPKPEIEISRIYALYIDANDFEIGIIQGIMEKSDQVHIGPEFETPQKFLGFDVCTLQFEWLSFLMNFGIDLSDVSNPGDFEPNGLVKRIEVAKKVRQFAEGAIPAHKPFGVWGIAECEIRI